MWLYELVNLLDGADETQLIRARDTARDTHRILALAGGCEHRAKIYWALSRACEARLDDIRENRTTEC